MRRGFSVYLIVLLLGGCSVADLPFVYQPDLQQGNVLTKDKVEQLEAGMSRRQVRFVLGTPPVVDPFRENRWDYVYLWVPGDGAKPQSHWLTVFFDGDRLDGIRGDLVAPDNPLNRPGAANG